MRTILLSAGAALAALSATVTAQGDLPAESGPACFIEIRQLMAEPPAGTGDLAGAIRALEAALRPQAAEINALKAQLARLEQRQVDGAPSASLDAAFEAEDSAARQAAPAADDRTAEEIRRVRAEVETKQAQLKLDYAAQQTALIGPVQARINRGAQVFAASSGCAEVKMARAPDLPALTAAGARNVTGEFVAWYLANPPA